MNKTTDSGRWPICVDFAEMTDVETTAILDFIEGRSHTLFLSRPMVCRNTLSCIDINDYASRTTKDSDS